MGSNSKSNNGPSLDDKLSNSGVLNNKTASNRRTVFAVDDQTIYLPNEKPSKPKNSIKKCVREFFEIISIRNNTAALVILCFCALMQNIIIGGSNNAILTTIERAYFMTSIQTATFLALYDVANIIASPIIGYFGDKMYKPVVIGLSMIGLSFGSIISTIPEFVIADQRLAENSVNSGSDNITGNSSAYQLCFYNYDVIKNSTIIPIATTTTLNTPYNSKSTSCGNEFLNNLKYVFYLANIVNGVSSVALYTTAISYIENIFTSKRATLCQGIYYAVGAIGVGIGMLATGNLLNVNASVGRRNSNNGHKIDSNNVNWIGAWWIIYAINAVISLILAILVLRFSKKLILKESIEETTTDDKSDKTRCCSKTSKNLSFKDHLQQFKNSGLKILTNKCYILIVLCTTSETLLIKGYSSYLTKFLEYQYRLPASTATMIAGAIGFVSLVGGALTGAFLIKQLKWNIKQCTKYIMIMQFITFPLFLGFLLYCPQETYINSSYLNENINYLSENNYLCNCDSSAFYPLCYKTEYLFQSPCHAGCTGIRGYNYTNCFMLTKLVKTSSSFDNDDLILKACSRPATQCVYRLVISSFIGLLVLFLSSTTLMPILKIILDCVDVKIQSFALGIRSLVTKLIGMHWYYSLILNKVFFKYCLFFFFKGNIPAPLIFASLVDKSCLQWITKACTGNKNCRLYDNKIFSLGLALLGCGFRFLSAIFALCAFLTLRNMSSYDVDTKCELNEVNGSSNKNGDVTNKSADIGSMNNNDKNNGIYILKL